MNGLHARNHPDRTEGAPTRRRALGWALLMHGLLLALLMIGLRWQTQPNTPVQAELWSAPPAAPTRPPLPRPTAPPPPAQPRPATASPPPPERSADIHTERVAAQRLAAQHAAEQKRAEQARAAQRQAQDKRQADERAAQREAAAAREAEQTLAQQRAAQKRLATQAAERAAAEKKAAAEAHQRASLAAEARRAADIRRLQQQAGSGPASAEGAGREAPGNGRMDAAYGGRIASAIRANTIYLIPADLEGNPKAEFLVQLRPDCSVLAVRLRKSSGLPAWDAAALRGIERTDPFPSPGTGGCQSEILISRGPRDTR